MWRVFYALKSLNLGGNKIPYDHTYIEKTTIIEDNVWIGTRSILLPGVHISEGAIIQAGAVVVSNVPYCAIYGGNPAHLIKYRNISHYELKKYEGQFN